MSQSPELVLAPGPHLHAPETTARIMWWVNGSLAPAALWGVFVFGAGALVTLAASIAGAAGAEWLAGRALRRQATLADGSAVCTGLLLALTLPPVMPWWMPLLGGAFAILVAKMMFGGLGFNLFNPALAGRAFMMATFPLAMTGAWVAPRAHFTAGLDAVTTATPLAALKEHGLAWKLPIEQGVTSIRSYVWMGVKAAWAVDFRPQDLRRLVLSILLHLPSNIGFVLFTKDSRVEGFVPGQS